MGKNTLGRKSESSEADFQIEDEHVSRTHLEVSLEETENKLFITLEDKSSLNGTFNKNKLRLKPSQKYPFKKDDFVIVGLSKITLKIN
jgi:pSer/pThr/pTyr-binding forkhead associated (FHA) protein